jgi:hypothetical protein
MLAMADSVIELGLDVAIASSICLRKKGRKKKNVRRSGHCEFEWSTD